MPGKKPECYVTMTDSALSGWGLAEGKKNKLIFACDSYQEAEIVAENARNRSEMKYINICARKPYFDQSKNFVQEKNKEVYPSWYKPGYFRARG